MPKTQASSIRVGSGEALGPEQQLCAPGACAPQATEPGAWRSPAGPARGCQPRRLPCPVEPQRHQAAVQGMAAQGAGKRSRAGSLHRP